MRRLSIPIEAVMDWVRRPLLGSKHDPMKWNNGVGSMRRLPGTATAAFPKTADPEDDAALPAEIAFQTPNLRSTAFISTSCPSLRPPVRGSYFFVAAGGCSAKAASSSFRAFASS